MAEKIKVSDIPLNDIVKDWRVKEYVRKEVRRLAKINIEKFRNYQGQILSCHAWLFPISYQAILRLHNKYKISVSEYNVLMGAYLFKRKGLNGFKAKELSSSLLPWHHSTIYRYLKQLSEKGYMRITKNPSSGLQRYYITWDGERVVRAYNQHFRMRFGEVWDSLGDFPASFSSLL
jgi:DNA-binding MarR family transcriptional regulator